MQSKQNQDHTLIQQAIAGDTDARSGISTLCDPIIRYQSDRFCRRFCKENRYRYRCSLARPQLGAATDAALCEWGNGSYAWMLDDLTHNQRLSKYRGDTGASLYDYLFAIANSLPFYERWKDWRFGRRIHVPTYIQALGEEAKPIFYALRQGDNPRLIAQNLGLELDRVEHLSHAIVVELTKRNRLYLLQAAKTTSLFASSGDDTDHDERDLDIADPTPGPEQLLASAELQQAWQRLDATEQYVLEALLIDNIDANDVLAALRQLDIAIHPNIAAADTNRQQLYYFKRKTLIKLKDYLAPV